MKKHVQLESQNIDFSFASVDFLTGDFYKFLKEEKILKNAIIIIAPDHLLPGGSKTYNEINKNKNRYLYLITNFKLKNYSERIINNLMIPRIIIDGAEIKTNATFLTDIINKKDNKFIENNFNKIARLNSQSVIYDQFSNGFQILKKDNYIILRNSKKVNKYKIKDNTNFLNLTFDKNFTPTYYEFTNFPRQITNYSYPGGRKNYFELMVKFNQKRLDKIYLLGNGLNEKKIFKSKNNIANIKFDDINGYQNFILSDFRNESDRFIAHAGGAIDGNIYTNSLEALNYSYEKGLRLFELDLQLSSDNKIVAVHSWKEWVKDTGYSGKIPPTEKDFLNYKIKGYLTPLNINLINKWFGEKKEAILITDKINDPKLIFQEFNFSNRLRMELFSKDAIIEAKKLNITAIPSYFVLQDMSNPIKFLKENDIKYVAASRAIISETNSNLKNLIKEIIGRNLLKKIYKSGIKIYAFNINYEKGKDEIYTMCNEFKYFYGLYADYWEIPNKKICN